MLDGLVAVGILSHVYNLHLAHLVDELLTGIDISTKRRGLLEHSVEFVDKGLVAAHQRDETADVMEHAPRPVPTVSFGERSPPGIWFEVIWEVAFRVATAHHTIFWMKHILVVLTTLLVDICLTGWTPQFLTHLVDAPVIIGIFQGA